MLDKGYDHPLHSLDLLGPAAEPPEGPRFVLADPAGRLAVRPALRRRARNVSTTVCEAALHAALVQHERAPSFFCAHGLDEAWLGGLRHWRRRMWHEEGLRHRATMELRLHQDRQRGALEGPRAAGGAGDDRCPLWPLGPPR